MCVYHIDILLLNFTMYSFILRYTGCIHFTCSFKLCCLTIDNCTNLLLLAMGPILPQINVVGRELGISPSVMGYLMSVLPIIYVLAKPLVGFLADYFAVSNLFSIW